MFAFLSHSHTHAHTHTHAHARAHTHTHVKGANSRRLDLNVCLSLSFTYSHTHTHTRTHTSAQQALPVGGYTSLFVSLLSNPNITVALSSDFHNLEHVLRPPTPTNAHTHTHTHPSPLFYTGPVDRFFKSADLGELEYRSLCSCNTLQHTATLLQHAAINCETVQDSATHCNTKAQL